MSKMFSTKIKTYKMRDAIDTKLSTPISNVRKVQCTINYLYNVNNAQYMIYFLISFLPNHILISFPTPSASFMSLQCAKIT